uniref:Uncharacterized protein n=1 Tax=Arion vulgaris TaxID=1028688 RepID=A0A0B7APF8_9EUPU
MKKYEKGSCDFSGFDEKEKFKIHCDNWSNKWMTRQRKTESVTILYNMAS